LLQEGFTTHCCHQQAIQEAYINGYPNLIYTPQNFSPLTKDEALEISNTKHKIPNNI